MSEKIKLNSGETPAEKPDSIPGQIPFFKFEEKELEEFDPNAGVLTAEDYLKSVILEARKEPDFIRADKAKLPSSPSKKLDRQELTFKQLSSSSYISTMNFMKDDKVDSKYLPTKLWKADRIRLFQNVRMKVGTHAGKLKSIRRESKKRPRLPIFPLPEPYDFEAWQKIIFGKTVPYVDFEDRKSEEELSSQESSKQIEENLEFADRILDIDNLEHGMPPVLRVVLRLTSHQISGLFDLFAELIEANQALQLALAEWIFAVLCIQQTPYEPAIASRIRAICRNCRKVRFQIVENGQADSRKQELTSLNFIILLISNFFDQKDLSD